MNPTVVYVSYLSHVPKSEILLVISWGQAPFEEYRISSLFFSPEVYLVVDMSHFLSNSRIYSLFWILDSAMYSPSHVVLFK